MWMRSHMSSITKCPAIRKIMFIGWGGPRAGAVGIAISLCDASEVLVLAEIEKLTCCPLIAMEDHAFTRHPSRPCIAGLSSLPLMSRHIGGASARETARVDET